MTISKREQKRLAMLNAARQLFSELGFAHTSMDLIAKTAEVSKQTLYSHFHDKKGIFQAAIQEYCIANRVGDSHAIIDTDLPVEQILLRIGTDFRALLLDEHALAMTKTCIASAKEQPEVSALFFEAGPLHLQSVMMAILEQLQQAGLLKFNNIQFACWQFLSMIKGDQYFRALLGVDIEDSETKQVDYLTHCVNMFIEVYKNS